MSESHSSPGQLYVSITVLKFHFLFPTQSLIECYSDWECNVGTNKQTWMEDFNGIIWTEEIENILDVSQRPNYKNLQSLLPMNFYQSSQESMKI